MYKVESGLDFDQLTEEEKENAPNNGCGKDMATYIRITDGWGTRVYSDAMEPEDATFHRDLSWIAIELQEAFDAGVSYETQGTEY